MTTRSLALALTLLAALGCPARAQEKPPQQQPDPEAERVEARLGELRTLLKQVEAKREESRVAGRPVERLNAEVEAVRAQLEQAERARAQLTLGRKQAELRRQLEELRAAKRMDEAEQVAARLAELDGQLELLDLPPGRFVPIGARLRDLTGPSGEARPPQTGKRAESLAVFAGESGEELELHVDDLRVSR